jgi:hypothetical protein
MVHDNCTCGLKLVLLCYILFPGNRGTAERREYFTFVYISIDLIVPLCADAFHSGPGISRLCFWVCWAESRY